MLWSSDQLISTTRSFWARPRMFFTHHTNRLPGLLVAMRASDAIAGAVRNDITQEVHQPLYELLLAADVPTTVAGYPDVSQ